MEQKQMWRKKNIKKEQTWNKNKFGIRTSMEQEQTLKGVFAKNEMGYRLNAIKKRF